MATAIKAFYNNHTRDMVNPGDPVVGCSEHELQGMERAGLVRLGGAKAPVVEPASPVSDAAADAGSSVPATSQGRTVTAKRTLRSALGEE